MTTTFSPAALESWTTQVFRAAGASAEDAALTAGVLVRTSLRGIDTHGMMRVAPYVEKLRSGEIKADAKPSHDFADGVLTYRGDSGLGQAVATRAIREAMRLAADHAVVPALICNSGHLAAIGQFVLDAAERGMFALICQETPPLMALPGSLSAAVGNNPIAYAIPVAGRAPLVFDMATSIVARGNVLQAKREGTALPHGWAIGPDGKPTNDPATALKGAMLPVAGHKGIGLAMLVQVLAGTLTGSMSAASAKAHAAQSSAGNVGAFVLVINPDRLVGREAFDAHVAEWLYTYLTASGAGSRYPGQRAAECEAERRVSGIPVATGLLAELRQTGELVGVPFAAEPVD